MTTTVTVSNSSSRQLPPTPTTTPTPTPTPTTTESTAYKYLLYISVGVNLILFILLVLVCLVGVYFKVQNSNCNGPSLATPLSQTLSSPANPSSSPATSSKTSSPSPVNSFQTPLPSPVPQSPNPANLTSSTSSRTPDLFFSIPSSSFYARISNPLPLHVPFVHPVPENSLHLPFPIYEPSDNFSSEKLPRNGNNVLSPVHHVVASQKNMSNDLDRSTTNEHYV